MNKERKIFIGIIALILIVGYVLLGNPLLRGSSERNVTYTETSTSGLMAVTASAQILATSTRAGGSICNPSSTLVYLNMNKDITATALTETTVIIGAATGYKACYELGDSYDGAIQASSTAASVNLFISEYKAR